MTQAKLKLYNTLTREKQEFKPLDIDADGNAQSVRMYVCGITPYDYAHIGNLRTIVVFDVLYRLLRHLYPAKANKETVEYVRNYTDIDDKIVQRAAEKGIDPFALSNEFIGIFERDMARMNVLDLPREQKPRVSDYMREIVSMVNGLLEKGFAYITASGDVMLSVPEFEKLGSPHNAFGHIARRTFDNLQARVEEDAEKRDTRDFPIWKANTKSATKMEQAFHPQELGATFAGFNAAGRPGWHIECSVMSEELLGKKYQPGHAALFDIHGGGEDLAFPHHSCEIAQTEAFHPECTMSSVWMHVAFLTVEGQKMSKSLNNFILVEDALKKYSPEAIRLWLLQTHYRKPVDYSDEALQSAENAVRSLYGSLKITLEVEFDEQGQVVESREVNTTIGFNSFEVDYEIINEFINLLSDDLDTPKALALLFRVRRDLSRSTDEREKNLLAQTLVRMGKTIGLIEDPDKYFKGGWKIYNDLWTEEALEQVISLREKLKKLKQFNEADELREKLKKAGIILEDGPTGTTWRRI